MVKPGVLPERPENPEGDADRDGEHQTDHSHLGRGRERLTDDVLDSLRSPRLVGRPEVEAEEPR